MVRLRRCTYIKGHLSTLEEYMKGNFSFFTLFLLIVCLPSSISEEDYKEEDNTYTLCKVVCIILDQFLPPLSFVTQCNLAHTIKHWLLLSIG